MTRSRFETWPEYLDRQAKRRQHWRDVRIMVGVCILGGLACVALGVLL
jgi:hypothetical protein